MDRRARLRDARLYFVADRGGMARALDGALAGGADVFQLRDKDATDDELLAAADSARERCHAAGALFVLNDRPDLAAACGADGVHVGQDDAPVQRAREQVGHDAIVGLSTHTMQQAQAGRRSGADYIAVGPVHATPTKEGRPAIGVEPVKYAAAHVSVPWFAIGGIDPATSPRWSRRVRGGSSSCARSPTRTIPRRRRARCAPRSTGRGVGRRSRKRRPEAGAPVAAPPPAAAPADRMRRGYARSEERNAAVRAQLQPLAPGERPPALVAAAVVAALLGAANLVALIAGLDVEGEQPSAIGVLLFCAVMFLAAGGLWLARYWAVLGFEALLGIIIVFFSLFLLRASNVLAVVVCVPIIGGAGWLFWKLIRVMGRLQAPQRVR